MPYPPQTIESLRAQRDTLRNYLAAGDFAPLEAYFDAAATEWLDAPWQDYGYTWHVHQLINKSPDLANAMVQLRAWCIVSPNSYHAHLLYGTAWEVAAGKIRSGYCADYVDDAQWVGAQMARDHGQVAYLRAITLHPRPALALHRMMRLTAYLGEPQWLANVTQNQEPTGQTEFQAQWSQEAWDGGLTLLSQYGDGLADIPDSIPITMPPRAPGELDDAKTYWLRLALQARTGDSYLLEDYLYFLYPRWGGSHAEMEAFIEGPICAALSDQQRDELRFTQALDYLGYQDYPDADDNEQIAAYTREFERCLALDLTPISRVHALCLFADFQRNLARSEQDAVAIWDAARLGQAYDLLAQALETGPTVTDLTDSAYPNTIYTLQACLWFKGLPDPKNLLSRVLDRAAKWGDNREALLIAAVGCRFGVLGFEPSAHNPEALIDQALKTDLPGFNIVQAGSNLAEVVPLEAIQFLWQECAARGDDMAMLGMSDLYAGKIYPHVSVLDKALSDRWLRRAAEAGCHIARINVAWKLMEESEALDTDTYLELKQWLEHTWENAPRLSRVETTSARHLARLLTMFSHNEEDKRLSLDHVLPWLWRQEDDMSTHWAAFRYALVFLEGRGCSPNRYLAKIWIDRALGIFPDNPLTQGLAHRIYRRGQFLGGWRAALAFHQDRRKVDERARQQTFGRGEPDHG
ncbi:DUF4034 domain-containing protein [Achromobacter sp. NCFB-sbj8-Ac1-l]|uniref:DUF4034 domain-containing protein n=1 Tax=unclassified Achromobacter TaxID=2626865 RepID=UPI004046BB5A